MVREMAEVLRLDVLSFSSISTAGVGRRKTTQLKDHQQRFLFGNRS